MQQRQLAQTVGAIALQLRRQLRKLLWVVACCGASVSWAAGIQQVTVPAAGADPDIKVLLWTPCHEVATEQSFGPYRLNATRDCAVTGDQLPLVLISHGDSGSYLGHHDTAAALADAGFVVAAVLHPGNNFTDNSQQNELTIFEQRPRHISRTIDYLTQHWSAHRQLDPARIGMFGFSRGGYTALALLGAAPNKAASAQRFCAPWWSFVIPLCRQLGDDTPELHPVADPRIKAAAVIDPLNLFGADSFKAVQAPVLLWASELGGDAVELSHIEAIRSQLAALRGFNVAKGAGHFVFLAPCPAELQQDASEICQDPAGVDRAQLHQTLNKSVLAFFQQHL